MKIYYIEPLSRGIERAKNALFKPMDPRKWFVVGFTAFLASFSDVGGGAPGMGFRRRSRIDMEQVLYFPQKAWEWLSLHPGWALLIAFALFFLCMIVVALTWISARGKFMLLDNVVLDEARVAVPWREYGREANSFFWLSLGLGVIFSAAAIAYIVYCFLYLQAVYETAGGGGALLLPAVLAGAGFLAISLAGAFVFVLLRDFVTQIMYKHRVGAGEAIQKFLPLLFSHLHRFIGYGIFRFLLMALVVLGVLIAGCVTCCVGFLLLSVPYIGAVVLLPVTYALRAFSIEFFGQFGPEWRLSATPAAGAPDAVPPVL